MNKIQIVGRLTRDAETKATGNGTEYTTFSVAVDRRVKKGEDKVSDFFDCVAWSKTGTLVSTYFRKGDVIAISGRMESDHYEKDGQKRVAWKLVVDDVYFVGGKKNDGAATTQPDIAPANTAVTPNFKAVDTDEELPF